MKKSELRQIIREEIAMAINEDEWAPVEKWLMNSSNRKKLAQRVKDSVLPGDAAFGDDPMKWGTNAWLDWIESDGNTQQYLQSMGVNIPGRPNRP